MNFILIRLILALIILMTSCNPVKNTSKIAAILTKEERADLDYLLRFLLFENYGVFVLFGSKPLCEMELFDAEVLQIEKQKFLQAMSQQERDEYERHIAELKAKGICVSFKPERNPIDGWKVIEKIKDRLNINRYLIAAHPVKNAPGIYNLFLVDIQKTALVLAENYEVFKKAVGFDFHPLDVVFEIEKNDSIFWQKIFELKNHQAKGLLFGFGKRNSVFFEWQLSYENIQSRIAKYVNSIPFKPSTDINIEMGKGGPNNFTIPIFGALEDDKFVKKYEEEKSKIEKIYRGKDLLEVTLKQLLQ